MKDANVSDIDPAPHLRIIDGKKRHRILREGLDELKLSKRQITGMEETFEQLKPRAELTTLETKKYQRSGENIKEHASEQLTKSRLLDRKVIILEQDITRLVNELRNYDISGVSRIDIQRALNECTVLLRYIKTQKTQVYVNFESRKT